MKPPKFNFVAENQLNVSNDNVGGYSVTITSASMLYFPKDTMHIFDLNTKFVKLFVDVEKKAIGWRVLEGQVDQATMGGVRQINANPQSGAAQLAVKKLLKAIGVTPEKAIKNLPVNKYKAAYLENELIYYIDLRNYVDTKKEGTNADNDEGTTQTEA